MGVVNTTYTFTGTDTITSSKLNNIIDDTTFTSDAISGSSLQIVSPGKLAVAAGGITANELATNSVTTAKITDSNVTTAKIADSNITQAKLGTNVVGNGPAFRASASGTTTLSASPTLINLAVENFDTNNNFSSNRFTPTVAGYYLITGAIEISGGGQNVQVSIYKTNVKAASGIQVSGLSYNSVCSDILYMNGTTDYVELFGVSSPGSTVAASGTGTYMSGCLIRSA